MSDEAVGYGQPPKAHQWQTGQSGNPAGYPVGVPNRGTVLKKLLALKHRYEDPTTGQEVEGTVEDAVNWGLIAKAMGGDTQAFKEIMDSVYGKLAEKQEITLPAKTVIKIGGKRPKTPDAAPAADS